MMSIEITAMPRTKMTVIIAAMTRTAVWAQSRFRHGLTRLSTTLSLWERSPSPSTRGSRIPSGSSQPAKFAAAKGKSRIQKARAVFPELIADQL